MGIFDFLKGGRPKTDAAGFFGRVGPRPGTPPDKKLVSLIKTATDRRAQQYDRDEALRKLVEVGTPDAAEGLLKRFSVQVDPSITDEEEKQIAYDGIVAIGQGKKGPGADEHDDAAVGALCAAVIDRSRAYCKSAENLTWALKVLRALENDGDYERELLNLLVLHDTEYMRNVEPKLNLLAALEAVESEPARLAVQGYLEDVNETVRFHAVQTLFEQGEPEAIPSLVAMLEREESVRVKNKVADGLIRRGWRVPAELKDSFRQSMTDAYEYTMAVDGTVLRV